MKIAPTLQGGLRIDVETPMDWMVLRCISYYARGGGLDMAERVFDPMNDQEIFADWREFVLPELRDTFNAQLDTIESAIAAAGPGEGPAKIHIAREDAELWYGGLNQARVGLEERYGFSTGSMAEMTPGKRSAWFCGQFYGDVQEALLSYVMR